MTAGNAETLANTANASANAAKSDAASAKSDAANAKTKLENGFDLSDYDERTLKFAFDYSEKLLAIDINIEINQMLDTAWGLFAKYFTREEVAIKEELIQKYWKEA